MTDHYVGWVDGLQITKMTKTLVSIERCRILTGNQRRLVQNYSIHGEMDGKMTISDQVNTVYLGQHQVRW